MLLASVLHKRCHLPIRSANGLALVPASARLMEDGRFQELSLPPLQMKASPVWRRFERVQLDSTISICTGHNTAEVGSQSNGPQFCRLRQKRSWMPGYPFSLKSLGLNGIDGPRNSETGFKRPCWSIHQNRKTKKLLHKTIVTIDYMYSSKRYSSVKFRSTCRFRRHLWTYRLCIFQAMPCQ
jgi:hypothetical protein